MTKIAIFDPALWDNDGTPSINLGDLIIKQGVDNILKELFPGANIFRISTHRPPSGALLKNAITADLCLVSGTNLLSSQVLTYNQWKLFDNMFEYSDPPDLNAVLCGVGWWQYQNAPDVVTRWYYKRLLARGGPHALRDGYSARHLASCGLDGLYNTSCPTMWGLDGRSTSRIGRSKTCLFTLTDYARDIVNDNWLIAFLATKYESLIYFPQGSHDAEYIVSLDAYAKYQSCIEMLPHEPGVLDELERRRDWDYIGTRLHAGIWSMTKGHSALILSVDNRAAEIGRETGLGVVERGDHDAIERWLLGCNLSSSQIVLPKDAINLWKERLVQYVAHRFASAMQVQQAEVIGPPSGALYVNLGCGGRARKGWLNIDAVETAPGVVVQDLARPLEIASNSADFIYTSHVLEHFSRSVAHYFLAECYRVLKPGGVLRVVVPDLAALAKAYLVCFQAAKENALQDIDQLRGEECFSRLEYATINLIDQLCRHEPGGEMLRFWARKPLPVSDYVIETNGVEVLRNIIALQHMESCGAKTEAIAGDALNIVEPPSFLKRLAYALAPKKFPIDICGCDSLNVLGRFRRSGEPHLWMYDEVSLSAMLAAFGFVDVEKKSASSSSIPNFKLFFLDTGMDGSVCKPDSLFFEAIK